MCGAIQGARCQIQTNIRQLDLGASTTAHQTSTATGGARVRANHAPAAAVQASAFGRGIIHMREASPRRQLLGVASAAASPGVAHHGRRLMAADRRRRRPVCGRAARRRGGLLTRLLRVEGAQVVAGGRGHAGRVGAARGRAVGREYLVAVLKVLRYGEVEHERIAVDAHVERLVEQDARDRLERLELVDLHVPLGLAELDHEQLVHVDGGVRGGGGRHAAQQPGEELCEPTAATVT